MTSKTRRDFFVGYPTLTSAGICHKLSKGQRRVKSRGGGIEKVKVWYSSKYSSWFLHFMELKDFTQNNIWGFFEKIVSRFFLKNFMIILLRNRVKWNSSTLKKHSVRFLFISHENPFGIIASKKLYSFFRFRKKLINSWAIIIYIHRYIEPYIFPWWTNKFWILSTYSSP